MPKQKRKELVALVRKINAYNLMLMLMLLKQLCELYRELPVENLKAMALAKMDSQTINGNGI